MTGAARSRALARARLGQNVMNWRNSYTRAAIFEDGTQQPGRRSRGLRHCRRAIAWANAQFEVGGTETYYRCLAACLGGYGGD